MRKTFQTLAAAAVAATGVTAAASGQTVVLSTSDFTTQATPEGRILIGRGEDYTPTDITHDVLFPKLRDSMHERRNFAWSVVERALKPQQLAKPGGESTEVPLWMTWYEDRGANGEIESLMHLYFRNLKTAFEGDPDPDIEAVVKATMEEFAAKDLSDSLRSATFESRLGQHLNNQNLEALAGRGGTLFSPSFVEHMMLNAKAAMACAGDSKADDPPPSDDQFSHCIPEFPASAVMIKTAWRPLAGGAPRYDTSAVGVGRAIRNGTWPNQVNGYTPPPIETPSASEIFTVADENDHRYALTGVHFVTKEVREWVWVSLWWDPQAQLDFGADKPDTLAAFNDGVWDNYKMCANTSFAEGDQQPWSAYDNDRNDREMMSLARALRSAHEVVVEQIRDGGASRPEDLMHTFSSGDLASPLYLADANGPWLAPYDQPTSWCSNPNIETHGGNARTSCIGCHQIAFTGNERRGGRASFADALTGDVAQYGRARVRRNFPAEFAWSFSASFRRYMVEAAIEADFEWPE